MPKSGCRPRRCQRSSGGSQSDNLNASNDPPLTCGKATQTFKFDDRTLINLAIKINQVGYLSDPEVKKYGYVGMWTGELNAYDFGPHAGAFEVRDATTHAVVLKGKPTLRRKANRGA